MSASGGLASHQRIVVTVPVDEPAPTGDGNCTPVRSVFAPLPPPSETCVAGCCGSDTGQCACRLGYIGARCDLQMRCAIVPDGASRFAVGVELSDGGHGSASAGSDGGDAPCLTQTTADGSKLVCTCSRTGAIGVIRFRVAPATNLLVFDRGFSRTDTAQLASGVAGWAALGVYSLLMLAALHVDARTMYVASGHRSVPQWLRPMAFTCASELMAALYLRTSVLRIFYVYPGHTMYSRAQVGSTPRRLQRTLDQL